MVRNCAPRWSPPAVRPDLIREKLGLADEAPILLFHGSVEADRGIEQLIAALGAPGLEDLHLVLLGNGELRDAFEVRSREPDVAGRLHLIPAVPPAELAPWVASADIGAVLQEPANQNLVLSTPNKLFEAIAVGTRSWRPTSPRSPGSSVTIRMVRWECCATRLTRKRSRQRSGRSSARRGHV